MSELESEVGFCLRGFVNGTTLVPRRLQIPVNNLASYLRDTLQLTSEGTTHRHTHTQTHNLASYLRDALQLTTEGTTHGVHRRRRRIASPMSATMGEEPNSR